MSASPEQVLADAHRFLSERGAESEARLVATLAGGGDSGWLVEEIEARQEASGTIAPASGVAGIRSTIEALAWLDALAIRDCEPTRRACVYLSAAQQEDGCWREPGADDVDPLGLTAAVASSLAKTRFGPASVLDRASTYLAGRWSVDLVQAGDFVPIEGYLHLLSNYPSDLSDEALQWCGRELERGFRTGAFGPVQVARLFVLCEAFALPGARLDGGEMVDALREAQQPDGGWPACNEAARTATTLDAAVSLVHLLGGRKPC